MSLYTENLHQTDISNSSFLITGGAGFIGSNIVEYLVQHGAGKIRILDNLSEGKLENIANFVELPNVQFMELDITNESDCRAACANIDYVSHQAALGSVPRSMETPLLTNAANVTGFLNLMTAAKDAGVKRFVYASSSSVYGDSPEMPKVESRIGDPLSPYAASKFTNEVYAGTFERCYGLETVGLRYFNVYGPRQKPDGPYAAVIPLFMDALLKDRAPFINGDGEQSRDFTFVSNAVQANIRGMFTSVSGASGKAYNIAVGERATVNQLFQTLQSLTGATVDAVYRDPRDGDVKHSLADISLAQEFLNYQPCTRFEEGLEITLDWFRKRFG
ncbi:MAG: SDR family oxidoreductase [Planctomycetota bacterium]|nr:SDR family oxidoreductase [Planctomycetota bacterium]